MSHDPERDAAAFVSGVMSPRRARRFEAHLVDCEDCWHEVSQGRLGRTLAESSRELAPVRLRETVRASVAADTPQRRGRARKPLAAGLVATATLLGTGLFAISSLVAEGQPAPIAAAVADFTNVRMAVAEPPHAAAPDLSDTSFELYHTGSGNLAGLEVDGFMYKDADGRRLLIYRSAVPFPVAGGATLTSADGPWRAAVDGIQLLCTQEPHALLALAEDEAALEELAAVLDIDA